MVLIVRLSSGLLWLKSKHLSLKLAPSRAPSGVMVKFPDGKEKDPGKAAPGGPPSKRPRVDQPAQRQPAAESASKARGAQKKGKLSFIEYLKSGDEMTEV
jgi:hypothetical protein